MPSDRDYRLANGKKVSGVTTIDNNIGWGKEGMIYNASRLGLEGKDYKEVWGKEMTSGSVAHALIEADLKGYLKKYEEEELPKIDPEIKEKAIGGWTSWDDWRKRMKFTLFKSELKLVSEKYKFGGTIDFIPYINDQLCIFDFKTGAVYETALLQTSAYRELAKENGIETPGGIHILQLGKEDASFKHYFYQSLPEAWEAFLAALKLHELHPKLKKMI